MPPQNSQKYAHGLIFQKSENFLDSKMSAAKRPKTFSVPNSAITMSNKMHMDPVDTIMPPICIYDRKILVINPMFLYACNEETSLKIYVLHSSEIENSDNDTVHNKYLVAFDLF